MQTSIVSLQEKEILGVSKNIIKPAGWVCEWNIGTPQRPKQCKISLASWNAYSKHLTNHCKDAHKKTAKTKQNWNFCRYPRCNLPSEVPLPSYNELVIHVQQSHMTRAQLQCPISGCPSPTFSRPALLESHFKEFHEGLSNKEFILPSPVLLPSWQPYYPHLAEPPPLPNEVLPGSSLTGVIEGKWKTQHPTMNRADSVKVMPSSPKKRPLMKQLSNIDVWEDVSKESESIIIFDDLPPQNKDGLYIGNVKFECILRGKKPETDADVSKPQRILDPDIFVHRTPPVTILYDAFARRLESLLAGPEPQMNCTKTHPSEPDVITN